MTAHLHVVPPPCDGCIHTLRELARASDALLAAQHRLEQDSRSPHTQATCDLRWSEYQTAYRAHAAHKQDHVHAATRAAL